MINYFIYRYYLYDNYGIIVIVIAVHSITTQRIITKLSLIFRFIYLCLIFEKTGNSKTNSMKSRLDYWGKLSLNILERETRFELATSTLARLRSTN